MPAAAAVPTVVVSTVYAAIVGVAESRLCR